MIYRTIYPQIPSPTFSSAKKSRSPSRSLKFPEDIQVVIRSDRPDYGSLFIGNIEAAENAELLQSLKITATLCLADGEGIKHSKSVIRYQGCVAFPDHGDADFSRELVGAVQFLQNNLVLTNVLIYCTSGGWRSACAAMAYLIKSRKISSEDAALEVKSRRKIITLSDDMLQQLKKYELDLCNTGLRKSKFNYSMRADPEQNVLPENKSYFNSQLSQSQISLPTKANNPKAHSVRSKSHQSYTKQFISPQIVFTRPKIYTNAENPEHSFREADKRCKSMAGFSSKSIKKDKVLQKSVRLPSEEPSFRNLNYQPIEVQVMNSEGSQLYDLALVKRQSKSREQFDRRIKFIDSRNELINSRLSNIQQTFEKTNEANKLLLECELKEIKMMEDSIVRQYRERTSRLKEKARTMRDSQVSSQAVQVPLSINKVQTLRDESMSMGQ